MPMLVMKAMNRHESSYPPVLSSCRTSVGLYLASNHVIAINPPIGSVMIVSCAGASPAKFLRKVMGEGGGGRVYSLATRAIDRPSDRAIERPSNRATERSSDRATERPSDRATERPRDRAIERSSDRTWESHNLGSTASPDVIPTPFDVEKQDLAIETIIET